MREPLQNPCDTNSDWDGTISRYMEWAQENKKRADRMLVAIERLNVVIWDTITGNGDYYEAMSELYTAAIDYQKE